MRHAQPPHRRVPPPPAGRHAAPPPNGRPRPDGPPPRHRSAQVNGAGPVNGTARPPANGAPPRRSAPPPGPGRFGGELDVPPAPVDPPTEVLRPVHPADAPTQVIRPVAPPPRPVPRRPVDPPTELIAPADHRDGDVADQDLDDDYDDYDDRDDHDRDDDPPPRRKASVGSIVIRSFGELMVTAGLVILLFVVYEVWITDLVSAQKQAEVTADLDRQWGAAPPPDPERTQKFEYADGEGIAKLYIPVFGPDYHFTIVEGTSEQNLEVGPGHYKKSAPPGQRGNFAVAGHRVGKGAPFNDLDLLNPCDAIVVETQTDWFVYRMLPTADQPVDAGSPRCAGVQAQTGEYAAAVGRRIVTPDKGEVVLPVPGNEGAKVPEDKLKPMLTLTTCHPKFSNAQRMIIHAVLVRSQPKSADPAAVPVELSES